jgi:dolichol-phosphate mannosyltransferase
MDISIIVPCYNEVENVSKIQKEFLPVVIELADVRSVEVVFVDDGSTDDTWQTLNDTFDNIDGAPDSLLPTAR